MFRFAVLMWAVQSMVCSAFDPDSLYWRVEIWMPLEHYNICLTAAAALQSLRLETSLMRQPDRFWMRFGGAVLFAYACRKWYLVLPQVTSTPFLPTDPYPVFLHLRQAVQLATAMLLISTRWAVELLGLNSPCRVHGRLFCVLMTASAVIGPLMKVSREWWFIEQNIYRLVVLACCSGWVIFTPAGGWRVGTSELAPSPSGSLPQHLPDAISGSGDGASSPRS